MVTRYSWRAYLIIYYITFNSLSVKVSLLFQTEHIIVSIIHQLEYHLPTTKQSQNWSLQINRLDPRPHTIKMQRKA